VTDGDGSASARAFRDGLRAQREIYAELAAHTRRQGEILLGGRTEEILALAHAKESILARIDRIDARIAPQKQRWRAERARLPVPVREEVQAELDLLHEALAGLIALEGDQQRHVESVRRESADQIRRIEGGRRVQRTYGAPAAPAPAPRRLDRSE